jgi:hypothetical protein
MPTLQNIQGSSLVGDPSSALNLLLQTFGTKQSRAADEAKRKRQAQTQEQVDILAGGGVIDESGAVGATPQQQQAALVRLSALNPQAANSIRQTLERGDQIELAEIAAETDKGTQVALQIQSQPDFVSKQRALSTLAQTASGRGEDVSRFVELSNMSEPQLDLELQKMLVQGADLKTLTASALKPPEPKFPTTREVKVGDEIVTQQIDPATGAITNIATGPRFRPPEAGTTITIGGEQVAQEVVTPPALLEGLPENTARKVDAVFVAAGGGKDGIDAINKVIDEFGAQERQQLVPNILDNSFPLATPAERAQLEATMASAKDTESGLAKAQTVRGEQRRLKKAGGFQDRAVALLDKIINNDQVGDVVGSIEGAIDIRLFSDAEAELIADIEEAANILTADNMDLMTGVLSESDIKILKNLSGGALNRKRTEKRFIGDLTELRNKLASKKVQTVDDETVGRFKVRAK